MPDKNKTPDLGILRKSEARMAAVKALYASKIIGDIDDKPDAHALALDILISYDVSDADNHFQVRPDEKFLAKLLAGVLKQQEEIDTIIVRNLSENWSKERMDYVMMGLLRAAVYELSSSPKLPFKIIINEYMNIARAFFNEKESGFVNGILDKIAREVREV